MKTKTKTPMKVVRDGQVAVLISRGFGAGWSTWNYEYADLLLFDKTLVEAAEDGVEDIKPIVEKLVGDDYVYCGGWEGVAIEWLPEGTRFSVEEYDGAESLRRLEDLEYVA